MKIVNKSFLAISLLLWVTSLSYAFANWDTWTGNSWSSLRSDDSWMRPVNPPPRSDDSWMKPSVDNTTNNNSQITLKWKIDWYKVKLSWDKYSGSEELLWYRILLSSSSWEQKTISVEASKTSVENWDAKPWINKYILFAVWEKWDLAESNSIVISMWPNWWYDFWSWSSNRSEPPRSQSGGMMPPPPPPQFSNSWSSRDDNRPERNDIRENRQEARENRQEFRQENWFLEQYLTWYTQEVRKQILDMKKEYQDKVFEIVKSSSWALSDDQKVQIDTLNTEFISKVSPLVWDNQKVLEFLKLRYDVFKENQDLRDQNKEMRQEYRQNFWKTNSWSVNNDKPREDNKQSWLKDKYKKLFEQKYSDKIASLSTDKVKLLISKIETLVQTYRDSTELTDTQKAQKIAQLEALRDILDDQLTQSESLIDVDSLLNQ
jgi:hypothetical protein